MRVASAMQTLTLGPLRSTAKLWIDDHGIPADRFYAGITNAPQQRLRAHRVDPKGDYTFFQASSDSVARAVERYLVDQVGCEGGSGGGDSSSTYLYIYRITRSTVQRT